MLNHGKFLLPKKSNSELWNEQCKANKEFFEAQYNPFSPHAEGGVIPEEVLCELIYKRVDTFLIESRLM